MLCPKIRGYLFAISFVVVIIVIVFEVIIVKRVLHDALASQEFCSN